MNLQAVSMKILNSLRMNLMTDTGRKKLAIVAIAALVAVVSVFGRISSASHTRYSEKREGLETKTDTSSYEEALERRLEEIISSVEGVGKCKVMITLEKDDRKIFAKDSYTEEKENKYEYVIVRSRDGGDDGLVENTVMPEIRGVAVVCDGGDSAVVRTEVISLVSSVFSLSSARISVSKME